VIFIFLMKDFQTNIHSLLLDCSNSKAGEDNCTVVSSNVIIHYSGEATIDQKVSMFDKLTNTIQAQVDSGVFEPVGTVHYAEAQMADGTEGDSSYDTQGSGSAPPMGAIGAAIAAVALIAAGIAGYVYVKKTRGGDDRCGSSAAVVPTDRGQTQIQQVLSGDVEIIDAGRGVRGHVFG
jgi:hypothetical protein